MASAADIRPSTALRDFWLDQNPLADSECKDFSAAPDWCNRRRVQPSDSYESKIEIIKIRDRGL